MNPHEEAGGECERDPCFTSYIQPLVFDMDTLPRYITWKSSHYAWRQWCVPTEMTLGFFLMNDHVYMIIYAIIKNITFTFSNIDTLPTPSDSYLPVLNPYFSILIPYHCHLTHICPTSSKSYITQAQKQVVSVNMPIFESGSAPSISLISI